MLECFVVARIDIFNILGDDDEPEIAMKYYRWGKTEGGSTEGECTSVDLSDTMRLWNDISCDTTLSYFICENITEEGKQTFLRAGIQS